VSERLRRVRRGVRGDVGGWSPPRGGSGAATNFFFGTTYFRDDILPGRHISGTT
jgi:hypothetical protein